MTAPRKPSAAPLSLGRPVCRRMAFTVSSRNGQIAHKDEWVWTVPSFPDPPASFYDIVMLVEAIGVHPPERLVDGHLVRGGTLISDVEAAAFVGVAPAVREAARR